MALEVTRVRIEHHAPGRIGIGETRPRLSWQIAGAEPGFVQREVEVRLSRTMPGESPVTGVIALEGPDQVLVPWPGEDLRSREAFEVAVRVRDAGAWSAWSDATVAEVGLLRADDWSARPVGAAGDPGAGPHRRPERLRREFALPAGIRRARAYVTAHGVIELEINGQRVGDEILTPGWTSYRHRLRYATFDVTDLLRAGDNAIGAWLGDGWWRGRLGFGGGLKDVYGDRLAAIVQLEVEAEDGTVARIVTDDSWSAGPGPILMSDLYDGERYDAREEGDGWTLPGYAAEGWAPVTIRDDGGAALVAPTGPPLRVVETLDPVAVEAKGEGRYILDFGQNHSGRLRLRADGPEGTLIRLRHAEVLVDGELCTEPLRTAEVTDELTLAGGSTEWTPRFTIHGYRYAEVSGWPGDLAPGDVVSEVIHSDMERLGWFESSDPLVDRLHENVVWSLRGNFVDIPTDCPQRDERLGWTGDIQAFAPTASFLYDVTGLLGSWLQDLAAEQIEYDWVPPYVPYLEIPPFDKLPRDPMAVWGDVALLTPLALFERTGDRGLLERQYASAQAWLASVEAGAGPDRICAGTEQLGDWLDPNAPPEDPTRAMTDRYLVATAYFAWSARRLARTAEHLDRPDDAARYDALADEVTEAYAARYITPDGRVQDDSQTAYALTEAFGLWPDEATRERGTARMAELVDAADGRVSTGFAGTPLVTDALSGSGHLEAAYRMLECQEAPSWLYAVLNGGTTIWERWDSLRPDGTVNAGDMTSFNHYALGAIADWMHRVVAGIEAVEPGWHRIRFAPRPGGSLTHAAARHLTPYGEASISWELSDGTLAVDVTVPVGATALLDMGDGERELGHGTHRASVAWPPAG
ncbi:family 78 glycoside hydrolase catalytic domain [Demequina sp. SYSU T00192]|uniref:alpha-L-rhamnosidase n=1 Tax=Demequina litoralis TaxID=3051660 RepID=A0ABT8GCM3_9MICO|nr:alpha-L-rhamnosidase [Demequina sp. SYSU T00192]MDN4476802.1 family 78 glycoside hydrolase catalytic domain [Demequina sp. SYSU T00192]